MNLKRIVRHLAMTDWQVRRMFTTRTLHAIEAAIKEGEQLHAGQIRFAVEGALPGTSLLGGQSAREQALEVFSLLRVWDTEHNNGVLIYLLLADHDVEIVADRGIHAKVGAREWENICRAMEAAFRQGRYEEGALEGIRAVTRCLVEHFPAGDQRVNELPDRPVVL
ncbi:MAG: TPM domain-containing protein [Pseudogulbenkiania sp.]|nr:TPM domain-containing protein [Pseudogulbenkiania sp.]